MAFANSHLDMCSIPIGRNWFPLSVFGSGPAKPTDQVLNSPLVVIRPWNFSLLSGLVSWQTSQLRTKFESQIVDSATRTGSLQFRRLTRSPND